MAQTAPGQSGLTDNDLAIKGLVVCLARMFKQKTSSLEAISNRDLGRDETMADKFMYIPNDKTPNYLFCRLQLVVETFGYLI